MVQCCERNLELAEDGEELVGLNPNASLDLANRGLIKVYSRRELLLRQIGGRTLLPNEPADLLSVPLHSSLRTIVATELLAEEEAERNTVDMKTPIGTQLKNARTRAKITQVDLAESLGFSNQGAVSRVERNAGATTTDRLSDWCERLGCDVVVVPTALAPAVAELASMDEEDQRLISTFATFVRESSRSDLYIVTRLIERMGAELGGQHMMEQTAAVKS